MAELWGRCKLDTLILSDGWVDFRPISLGISPGVEQITRPQDWIAFRQMLFTSAEALEARLRPNWSTDALAEA